MGVDLMMTAIENEMTRSVNGMDPDTGGGKYGDGRDVLVPLGAYRTQQRKNDANESLSNQGKRNANRKYATDKTAPELNWIPRRIKALQDKDQQYRTQFFTITSGIDNTAEQMLMYHYLWPKFDAMDQAARVTQFVQASERDNTLIMAAMLENPFGPMINEEVKARALTERAKRLTSNDYHNFEQNLMLLEFIVMVRDWIARWLFSEVGVELSVIRANLGDEIADALDGMPSQTETQLTGASK